MTGNHHNMTPGHRQFNYSFIWLQNLHKCEKSKNDIFLQIQNFIFFIYFKLTWAKAQGELLSSPYVRRPSSTISLLTF